MNPKTLAKSLGACLAVVALAAPARAQFSPVVPRLENRPALLVETDYYVYGPGVGFTDPDVTMTVQANGFDQPVTLFFYWQNRANGDRQYFNMNAGFVGAQRDFFGQAGQPRRLIAANLGDVKLFGANSALGPLPNAIPSSTGRYMFVVELRDGAGQQVISRANTMFNHVDGVVSHAGVLRADETWGNENAHFLAAPVFVGNGVTLNLEPGTIILGSQAGQGTLITVRGARLEAPGRPFDPIILTSEVPVGQRRAGLWGGLVINGFAPTNQGTSPPPEGEGNSGPFGGNIVGDSSGTLQYVRVEWAGIRFSEQNELNGIAFQGTGRGTVVDHIQVHMNQDDGVEFFGGTADARYVLITGAEDDSLDWTFGWEGRLQYFVSIQCGDKEQDNGIEADNFENNEDALPRSDPTIRNSTWAGDGRHLPGASDNGNLIRRGTHVSIANAIIADFTDFGIEIDGPASNAALGGNGISYGTTLLHRNATDANVPLGQLGDVSVEDPEFFDDPIGRPGCGVVPDVTCGNCDGGSRGSGFFDPAPFIGGVDPNDQWIDDGWTTFSDD